jgi:hypothetical protein
LIEGIGAKAGKGAPARFAGDRWFVLSAKTGFRISICIGTSIPAVIGTDFKKILMVLAGGG